jgi:hypothetical protein
MRTGLFGLLVVAAGATFLPADAQDKPSFGDLLARARAQAAAGHRWSPPGDNMTETIAGMMDLVPTATPQQLKDLSALLESDAPRAPAAAEQTSAPTVATMQPSAPAGTTTQPTTPTVATMQPSAPDVATIQPSAPTVATTQPSTPTVATMQPSAPDVATVQSSAPADTTTQPSAPTVAITETSGVAVARPVVTETAAEPAPDRASTRPASTSKPVPVLAPPRPVVVRPGPRAMELFVRGQQAEREGDVSGARRFYATAAEQGSAAAARSLGRLYDPGYLKQAAIGGIDPNPALARHWYERAVGMGDTQAAPLLQALAAR